MKLSQIFWVILAVALFLRVWTLGTPFTSDENPWPYAAADHSSSGFNFVIDRGFDKFIWTSPPLAPLAYRFFTWFIGVNEVTMRFLPLIIGLVNIWLTYLLARRIFDPKSAVFAASLMAVSFWHVLASFLIEHDSSILTLFWLLFFHSWLWFETTGKTKWLVWCGIVLGLALLTKLTGGLMLIALAIYLVWKHGSIKEPAITCAKILGIGLAVFAVFPILSLLIYPAYIKETLLHSGVLTLIPSLFSPIRIIIYLLLWATPLLTGLAILSLSELDKRARVLWCWAGATVLFYTLTKYLGAIDRYMAVMIPALCILGGRELAKRIEFKDIKKVLLIALPFLGFLIALNFIPSRWIEHNVYNYIVRAITFDWTFVFQFWGGGGPAFMTSFIPLGAGLALCIAALALFIYAVHSEKEKAIGRSFILFVAVALAFNLFIVQAFIVKEPYPDVGAVTKGIIAEIQNLPGPYYANDMNLAWYADKKADFYVIGDVYSDEQKEIDQLRGIIRRRGGTLIITDYPKHLKTDNIWQLAGECRLHKTFGSKEIILGYVFACEPHVV
ncbi:MAG: glycosyltransferase family 39 protein [Candidatus Woesearchaeota archaeon]